MGAPRRAWRRRRAPHRSHTPPTPPPPSRPPQVTSEAEIASLLPLAAAHGVPVTFRAAGTSLSGQAITDSVLLKLSHVGTAFRRHEVHGDGSRVTVEPGLIGGEVNAILARHARSTKAAVQYKIGPDPSSIDSCMVGGIVANNSSGMCCGVSQNTYHTLADLRAVLVDGTVLDTADPASVAAFERSHATLLAGVAALAKRVQADPQLAALIRRKFAIKCTTGYSLNALVDFPADRPVEIVKRLLVGSEGTLAFVSRATYNTVPDWPHKGARSCFFFASFFPPFFFLCPPTRPPRTPPPSSLGVRHVPRRARRVPRGVGAARLHRGRRGGDVRPRVAAPGVWRGGGGGREKGGEKRGARATTDPPSSPPSSL